MSVHGDRLVGANVCAGTAVATGLFVDDGLIVLNLDGVQGAGLDAFSASATGFQIYLSSHSIETPLGASTELVNRMICWSDQPEDIPFFLYAFLPEPEAIPRTLPPKTPSPGV